MVVSRLFLKLRTLSDQSFNSYFPFCLLRHLLLLIFPREVWMILPPWIIGVRIRIVLLQELDLFNLLRSCKTIHSLVRAVTNLTADSLSRLNLGRSLSLNSHLLESSLDFSCNLVLHFNNLVCNL